MAREAKRQPVTRERLLDAALELVDREGLEAVSMRRLGAALGVEAMSLYNHVDGKRGVLDGLFERVLAELPPPPKTSSWVKALRERANALRTVLESHPRALALFATRAAVTPASLEHLEGVLAVLRGAGFSAKDSLAALQTLLAFVVGHTIASTGLAADEAPRPKYDTLDARTFRHVREVAAVLPSYDVDAEFRFGVDTFLSGLEARLR